MSIGLALYCPFKAYSDEISVSYMYKLSDFTGTIPFSWVKMSVDRVRREIYVTDEDYSVRVFSDTGMELYRFNEDQSLGSVQSTVVDKDGNILILSYAVSPVWQYRIIRCNYRGDPMETLALKNIPPEFSEGFSPTILAYREGHLYLVDGGAMKIIVMDEQGLFEQGIDVFSLVLDEKEKREKKRGDYEMLGFSVDREGNMLFTVPVLFRAFRLSPDGKLTSFGERGGAPGKFNIAAGIVSDDRGYFYVADRLKCSILIFDQNFNFLLQVGNRGYRDQDLVVPTNIAVLGDRLYVSQAAGRGVSVFGIKR